MQCKVDGCPRDTYTGSELCKAHYTAVSAAVQAEAQATREHEERSGADTRFVDLCEKLRAMGATEVQVGSRRATFTPLAPTQLLDLPRPNSPRVPKAETRIQREDRMRREEEERRARELRSVGGGG